MVSEQKDMLGYNEAEPRAESGTSTMKTASPKLRLVEEIASTGEAIVTFEDGTVVEFHGSDIHMYPDTGVIFTETDGPDGQGAESWFFADEIVSVQRH